MEPLLKRLSKTWLLFAYFIPLLIGGGCGYHFSGGGRLPENVTRICVQVFDNRTGETGLEHTIANEIINYFTRFENVELAGKEEAQAVLTGEVKSSSISLIRSHLTKKCWRI